MQRTLFLTSNLSGIWRHGEFGNNRVSNKGHQCSHRSMIKWLTEASACFCIEIFPFSLQHKDKSHRKKNLSSTQYITHSGTDNHISSLWEEIFFTELYGPILYLDCLGVGYGRCGSPSLLKPVFFGAVLKDSPPVSFPSPNTCTLISPLFVLNQHSISHANPMLCFSICC